MFQMFRIHSLVLSLPIALDGSSVLLSTHYVGEKGDAEADREKHAWGKIRNKTFLICLLLSLSANFPSKKR